MLNNDQNGWNAAYTMGTMRKPTDTSTMVPDGMEPGGSEIDWMWYGVGAILAVMMPYRRVGDMHRFIHKHLKCFLLKKTNESLYLKWSIYIAD